MAEERVELERVSPSDDLPLARAAYSRAASYTATPGYGYGYGNGEEEGVNFRDVWRIIRRRRWLILSLAVIITTVVTIESYRTRSTYQASAFIEIGKESPAVRTGNGDTVIQSEDADLYYPQLSINTNMFRLTSEPLLEDVVVSLKLDENPNFVDMQKKSVWEAVELFGARLGLKKKEEPPPAKSDALVETVNTTSPRTPEESERLAPYVGIISGGIQAEQVKDTRTLKITFTHTDPVIAAAVANGVARIFIESSFENKTEHFTNASKWLDATTREFQAKVEKAEQALADYTREHNIFSVDGKETLITDKLSRLHDQATRAETDRILKQSLYEEVKAGRVTQLPAAFADTKISSLQAKLDELQGLADKLNLKYGDENPQVIEVRQQISTINGQIEAARKALEEKLKGEYLATLRDEQSLKTALQQSKGEAVQQNQDAIQYGILKQEVDTAKTLYNDFLQKTSQAKVQVAQQHNNLRLIQPARVPKSPLGPSHFRTILLGLLLSVGAGVGLAYFLEYLDNTIKTVEDVGRYVQLPALGVIPAIASASTGRAVNPKKARRLIAHSEAAHENMEALDPANHVMLFDNLSSAAEAYRAVRTSILLSAASRPPKIILVTSGQPGEGKTTTAVNTAVSLTQLGARVLLIDCDLRKPMIHKLFGLDQAHGLSTYLSRDVKIEKVMSNAQVPNLDLLPCGPIPPNPSELISSEKMKNLLQIMSERYDHILIDSPPLMNVSDSVILSSMVDGVILVVHGGKSPRAIAQRARQELVNVGAKIFGVVLNNVDLRREGYERYYYSRYYSEPARDAEAG
ncbi:MAG TPA: polysaccharide biosynthesis tyrosine autokinase [Blastocatellia bacterium]|nr:polysaccharide biosynthesis tyrosine autokinase [Blastocatellia bacterium]